MFDEVPLPPEYDEGDLGASWWGRNSIAGISVTTLGLGVFNAWNWYAFRRPDSAIDAVMNTVIAVILAFVHKERRNAQRYVEARRRAAEESRPHELESRAKN